MKLSPRHRAMLGASHEARTTVRTATSSLVASLRSFYHPKQAAFFQSPHRLRMLLKTRRAGATVGGCRELLARALEIRGFRATVTHTTAIEARKRAWENDTDNALVNIVRQFGERTDRKRGVEQYQLGGVTVDVYDGEMVLEFSNGSQINLMGADGTGDISKQRGGAKHVFWIDEAQDFQLLEPFYQKVAVAAMQDFKGECWVTGTPGQDCAGMFYDATKDPESSDTVEVQALQSAWEVHQFAQVDNPFFGATEAERYERTAAEALRLNGWTVEHPDFQREIMGKWVRSDANYVYAVHQVPEHELTFAPARHDVDGFPELELALADLPHYAGREYFIQAGADLGTRAAFAFVLWSWSLLDPCLYEVASWKKSGLDYDEMAAILIRVRERVHVGAITADAGGGGKPAVMGWSKAWLERYHVPIEEAEKHNKQVAIKMLNNDIRTGKVRLRSGGVLLAEMKVHRWEKLRSATGQLVEASTPHDACDGGLYGHRMSYHHRGAPPEDKPPVGSEEHLQREERAMEQAAEDEVSDRPWWS